MLLGGIGDDKIWDRYNNDTLKGDDGDDTLYGGRDIMRDIESVTFSGDQSNSHTDDLVA